MNQFETREQYLVAAANTLAQDLFPLANIKMPERWYVSVMEPAGRTIGRAWPASHDAHHMFVSAVLSNPVDVLATLLHEMIHLAVGVKEKHNKVFGKAARAVGLKGKLTATTADEKLAEYLKNVDTLLGGYPHRPLARPIRTTAQRLRRVQLVSPTMPEYKLLISRRWLDRVGYPLDPNGDQMVEE